MARDRFARFEGARVHYLDSGRGKEALVLVHGWGGDGSAWTAQRESFSGRMLVVDLPGHGRSGRPRTRYSLEYFARSLNAVLTHSGVERAVLVGHSMGAPIVGRFVGLFPEKTLGLVLVDGAMRPFLPVEKMDKLIGELRGDYRRTMVSIAEDIVKPISDKKAAALVKAALRACPEHVCISSMEGMADAAAYERDPIGVPVLAILADSHEWSDDTEPFLRSLAPKLKVSRWSGVSHFLMLDDRRKFAAEIRSFLDEQGLLSGR